MRVPWDKVFLILGKSSLKEEKVGKEQGLLVKQEKLFAGRECLNCGVLDELVSTLIVEGLPWDLDSPNASYDGTTMGACERLFSPCARVLVQRGWSEKDLTGGVALLRNRDVSGLFTERQGEWEALRAMWKLMDMVNYLFEQESWGEEVGDVGILQTCIQLMFVHRRTLVDNNWSDEEIVRGMDWLRERDVRELAVMEKKPEVPDRGLVTERVENGKAAK